MSGPRIRRYSRREPAHTGGAAKAKPGPPGGVPPAQLLRPRRDPLAARLGCQFFFYTLLDDTRGIGQYDAPVRAYHFNIRPQSLR